MGVEWGVIAGAISQNPRAEPVTEGNWGDWLEGGGGGGVG